MARRTLRKQDNIEKMKNLYAQRGYTDIEMAELLDIDRTTVHRTRRFMEEQMGLPFYQEDDGRHRLDPQHLLSNLQVTPAEALALYLGGRRLQQQTRSNQVDVANALYKLSQTLRRPLMGQLVRAAEVILEQEQDHEQRSVMGALLRGWLEGYRVRIRHRKLHGELRTYTVSPYVLEPAVWGDGVYLIGHSDYHEGLATFKVARIVEAHLLPEPYTIPEDFDIHALLQHAWGIWHADGAPQTVRLRFTRAVAPRVKESIWHPSQTIRDLEDGGCEWRAEVAEWREMAPWIRGWGANCEVLAPEVLRDELAHTVQRLAALYGIRSEEPMAKYYAHSQNNLGVRQGLVEHLRAVAAITHRFSSVFNGEGIGYYVGLWHDLGKFHPEWQRRLLAAEQYKAQTGQHKRVGIDHKAAGVLMLNQHTQDAALVALALQGHHGGLKTPADLKQWLGTRAEDAKEALVVAGKVIPDVAPPLPLSLPAFVGRNPLKLEFFLRFLFSTLVDADALDTERHVAAWKGEQRVIGISLETLEQRLETAQAMFGRPNTVVNQARAAIYDSCLQTADGAPGLYRLTVPTGGGKTRSAMAFALRHARRHGMCRVIVAVPYMTITEQTAAVYRNIFEKGNEHVILEHHSAAVETEKEDGLWQRLAAENWDAPITVTTTVQLFESLFAGGPARCRKVHRLANSVIVLDEAQTLPIHLLTPILDALQQLCTDYNTTVVLSTATQPAWEAIPAFRDVPAQEIVPEPESFFHTLKRVDYDWSRARVPLSWDEVAGLLDDEAQALVIVNTKSDALALLEAISDPEALHLSTLLCGAHRRRVVDEVKRRLATGEPCRLIATQVVEAGVDIDFPLVLRALGPLDSIIQAAGRANREGRLERGRIIVFQPADGKLPPGAYAHATAQTVTLLRDGPIDVENAATLREYYELWYGLEDADRHGIQQARQQLLFPTVAEAFRMIEDDTVSVVITAYGTKEEQQKVRRLVDQVQSGNGSTRLLLRQLQPYFITLRRREAEKHWRAGLIVPLSGVGGGELGGIGEWLGGYDASPDLIGGRGLVASDRDIADFVS